MIKEKKINGNINWWICILIAFIVGAIVAAIFSFSTMPIAEGWYTEYAWQINNGSVPYRDFEYLFFPFYINLIALFTKVFGYKIVALRIFGIIIYAGIGAALYCIYAKMFNNVVGLISSIITIFYIQSEKVQVFYDYIRVHDLLAIIGTAFLVYYIYNCYNKKTLDYNASTIVIEIIAIVGTIVSGIWGVIYCADNGSKEIIIFISLLVIAAILIIDVFFSIKKKIFIPIQALVCGIFISSECMVKQSNGMIMLLFVFILLLFLYIIFKDKQFLNGLRGFIIGCIICFSLLFIYLLANQSLIQFFECCFKNALAAKGGVFLELFQWIPTAIGQLWQEKIIVIIFFILTDFLLFILFRKNNSNKFGEGKFEKTAIIFTSVVAILILIIVPLLRSSSSQMASYYNNNIPAIVFFSMAIIFIGLIIYFLLAQKNDVFLIKAEMIIAFSVIGVTIAQGWGSGMSGGLGVSQIALGVGLMAGIVLFLAFKSRRMIISLCTLFYLIVISTTFIAKKTTETYDWWGLLQGPLCEHIEYVDVPLLEGIKVRPTEKILYETIYKDITEHTDSDDPIFCFPHCPIIYSITNRHFSNTYSKVQWFDVSSQNSINKDILSLKENHPKVIVYIDVPEYVYEGHENGFQTYQTRKMKDFLLKDLVKKNNYKKLHNIDMGNGYKAVTYLLID